MHAGLGRHTTAVGGPVNPDQVVLYYKVALAIRACLTEITETPCSDIPSSSIVLLQFRCCDQNVADPPLLPDIRRPSMVSTRVDGSLDSCYTVLHRGFLCRSI